MDNIKERAGRNRTIYLTPDQEHEYLKKCINESSVIKSSPIIDKIVFGNCFNVLPNLPNNSVDLLIVDRLII